MNTKDMIAKQNCNKFVSYLREFYRIGNKTLVGKFARWASYFLESVEDEIGYDALKLIYEILDDRFKSGEWSKNGQPDF